MVYKRRTDIIDIIYCFFDLQLRDIEDILNISGHTVRRIRKELALTKWPLERLKRQETFEWRGHTISWEGVQLLRTATIPKVSAQMQEILRECDQKGMLMRVLYLPGYAQTARTKKASASSEIMPAIVVPPPVPDGPEENKDDERLLLEELGLLHQPFMPPTDQPEYHYDAPPDTGADDYWPCLEPTPEQDLYWEDVGRLLFEIEPV